MCFASSASENMSRAVWESKFYGAFVLNYRVVLHAIDATPARWRGDAGSSPLDRAVHPTHWLISTQLVTTAVGFAPWLTTRSAPSGVLISVAWRRDTRGLVMLPLRSPWRPSSTTCKSGSGVTRPARLRSESGGARSCCGGCRGVARACMAASLLVLWLRCGFTSRLAVVSGVKVAATAVYVVASAAVCGPKGSLPVWRARGVRVAPLVGRM